MINIFLILIICVLIVILFYLMNSVLSSSLSDDYDNARNGDYKSVTQCKQCEIIDYYWYQHPVNPCKKCGGKVFEISAHKYDKVTKKWVK